MRTILLIISVLSIAIGVVVSYVFFDSLMREYTYQGLGKVLLTESGQVGDFIGGVVGTIFSLAGFLVLALTLLAQSESTYSERFESKFFELIRLHRDNVVDLHMSKSLLKGGKVIEAEFSKREVFKKILDDVLKCREELQPFFNKRTLNEIYEADFLSKLAATIRSINPDIDLKALAKIGIPYCIVYYGVDSEGIRILKKIFNGKYKERFTDEIVSYAQMKPVHDSLYWPKWAAVEKISAFKIRKPLVRAIRLKRNSNPNLIGYTQRVLVMANQFFYRNDFIKYYGGHQFRLGHYFRHLFQTVKFVHTQKKLSSKEKYYYIKTLRAQLSTHEQALLFLNSLSILGMAWELMPEYDKSIFGLSDIKSMRNNSLITRYSLIKNLPGDDLFGIRFKDFYPKVDYEGERI